MLHTRPANTTDQRLEAAFEVWNRLGAANDTSVLAALERGDLTTAAQRASLLAVRLAELAPSHS
jgi:hypothetical protein